MIDSDSKSGKITSSNIESKSNISTTNTNDTKIANITTNDKSEKMLKSTRKISKSVKRRSTADIPTQKTFNKKKQKKAKTGLQTNEQKSNTTRNSTPISTLTGTPFTSTGVSYLNENIQSGALNIAQELAMNRNNTLNSLSPEITYIISSQNQIADNPFQNIHNDNSFSSIPNSAPTTNTNNSNNNNNNNTLTQADNKPMKITSLISKTVYPRQRRLLNPGNGKLEMLNSHINIENDNNNKNAIVITPDNNTSNSTVSNLYLKSMQLLNHKNNSKNNNNNYITGSDNHTQSNILPVSSTENLTSNNEEYFFSSSIGSTSTPSSNIVNNMPLPVLASSNTKTQSKKKQIVKKSIETKNDQSSILDGTSSSVNTITSVNNSSSEVTKSTSSQVLTSTTNRKVSTKKTATLRKKKTNSDNKTTSSPNVNTTNTTTVPVTSVAASIHLNDIIESKVKNLPTLKPKPTNTSNNNIMTSPNTRITISKTHMPSVTPPLSTTSDNPNNNDSEVSTPKSNSPSQSNLKKSASSTTPSSKTKTKNTAKSTSTSSSTSPTALTISNMTNKQSSKPITANYTGSATTFSKINDNSNPTSSPTATTIVARTATNSANTPSVKLTEKKKSVVKVLLSAPIIENPSLVKSASILSEPKSQLDHKSSKNTSTKEEKAVILNIPLYDTSVNDYLDENGTVVVNVIDLINKKMIHNNSKDKANLEQEKINKRGIFINKTDKVNLTGINTDGDDINKDTKKKAHPMKGKSQIGKYDMEDPFIDDSELLWEEQRATTKDGFFVFFGPLIEKDDVPKIERTQSSLKRSRR
ncbi:hypothetical protein RI543_003700 [Arxiozyma heterogenica]|uniref:Hpc2-related domain-containing protein n=1 Tax=Arxiozyma heterogenica TaxID=278026 RepID=A0AAN7WNJ3_9SACH|nr:hypothetical protein RI543_003700 [Kazachstania heterogenica]